MPRQGAGQPSTGASADVLSNVQSMCSEASGSVSDWAKANPAKVKVALAAGGATTLAAVWLARRWWQNRALPPGPIGLPLIGCPRLLDQSQWFRSLMEIGHGYNDGTFSFYCGSQLVIVVTKYDAISSMLKDANDFEGRDAVIRRVRSGRGIVCSEGEHWGKHRDVCMDTIINIVRGTEVHAVLNSAIDVLFETLLTMGETPSDEAVRGALETAVAKLMSKIVFGVELNMEQSSIFQEFCTSLKELWKIPPITAAHQCSLLQLREPRSLRDCREKLKVLFDPIFKAREELIQRQTSPQGKNNTKAESLCENYILHRNKEGKSEVSDAFSCEQILDTCLDFFSHGMESLVTTLEWLLLYMAFHWDEQGEVRDELKENADDLKHPKISELKKVVFTHAVISECLRMASPVSIGIPHRAVRDTDFMGHRIPQGAVILPHIYACHHDEDAWVNPDRFEPSRFMHDSLGHSNAHHRIPFLFGARGCVADVWTQEVIYVIFTSFIRKFKVQPAPEDAENKESILRGTGSFIHRPGRYKLKITEA